MVDTTGSMGASIETVKQAAIQLVGDVTSRTGAARFALVDYRDFQDRTGTPGDYPALLRQDFTTDPDEIDDAIQGLALGDGGDTPETMYSGIMSAFDLAWRPGVKKLTIVLTDARALDPEPVTGYTADFVVNRSLAIDPVEMHFVTVNGYGSDALMLDMATRTNGAVHESSASEAATEIAQVIDESLDRPYAWAGGPYVGQDRGDRHARRARLLRRHLRPRHVGVGRRQRRDVRHHERRADGAAHVRVRGRRVRDAARDRRRRQVEHRDRGHALHRRRRRDPGRRGQLPRRGQPGSGRRGPRRPGDACDPTPGYPTRDLDGVLDSGTPTTPSPGGGGPPVRAQADVDVRRPRFVRTERGLRLRLKVVCTRSSGDCAGTVRVKIGKRSKSARYAIKAGRARSSRSRCRPSPHGSCGTASA